MSEWKECTLEDIADIIPGFAFKSKHFSDNLGQSKVIKITDISPPYIDVSNAMYIDMSHYDHKKMQKYIISKGDFVVAMTGATIGKVGRMQGDKAAYINQRVATFRSKANTCADFVYYSISGSEFQGFIQNNIDSNSAQENISGTSIGRFPILLPPLPEQKAIAAVLSSLDDKIDLLQRQNKTLEAMAETLFRQWFVEEADAGWEEGSLINLIELVGGGTPNTSMPEYWEGEIPWLSGGDITVNHKSFVMNSEKSISDKGLDNSSAKLLPKYSTVISARGTVGRYCLLIKPMTFSQSNYGILPRIDGCFFYTYLLINHVVEELQSSAYGSVFDTITTSTFKDIKINIPKENFIKEFEAIITPYFERMLVNVEQIQTLVNLRDTLLPKLMSGEVRVAL